MSKKIYRKNARRYDQTERMCDMKKEMRDTMENRKGQKPNRRGGLAVALTVLLIAGGRIPHLAAGHVQRA